MARGNKRHDRTPTMHGAVVMYHLLKGRRWKTAQWAQSLGLTNQGAIRIFNLLESEHDFCVAQDEDRRWTLWENGEPVR